MNESPTFCELPSDALRDEVVALFPALLGLCLPLSLSLFRVFCLAFRDGYARTSSRTVSVSRTTE